MSQMEGGGKGEGTCRSRGTGCEGQRPQVEACSHVTEKRSRVENEEGETWNGMDQNLTFQRMSASFKYVQKGLPGFT